ncbi:MAG: NAD-dependent epimerase/dehydratase family protein [Pseudomonadota bacterium]|nr:NAD-dependent epimerase/dehydratase family protein [Pseudomonadota bacterium]
MAQDKPIVLITGIAGDIGTALAGVLKRDFRVIGLDRKAPEGGGHDYAFLEADLTDDASVQAAIREIAGAHGSRIASVVHLAAYFDFSGEDNALYQDLNVEGTRRLLEALKALEVEQFIYAGTMLVHAPVGPGQRIDETAPVAPKWAYPESKAAAEEVIARHATFPYVLLRMAGVYDDESVVPTLGQQIARIYERDLQSHLYAGDLLAGQAMLHKTDMIDAFVRCIDRRDRLPPALALLVGENEGVGYQPLQEELGELIHGKDDWKTIRVPAPVAKLGAWAGVKAEPLVPDKLDQGRKPFIRPFMIEMASDHYALDTAKARDLLGWLPRHDIRDSLPSVVTALKRDPLAWYQAHKIVPPAWLRTAAEKVDDPDALRTRADREYRQEHHRNAWAPFATAALGTWLITSPPMMGYAGTLLGWSDIISGLALLVLGLLSLSPTMALLRYASATVGLWLLLAPLVFWTGNAAAYLNDTLVGTLAIGFALLVRPAPGVDRVARLTGPSIPKGWSYSPSSWSQRLPIILLAFVGLYVSRYMAAYQLGHIDAVWEPFFMGSAANPRNGTEEIITSSVSEAWPVPDAGLGALVYVLEIITGMLGSTRRWRTMPWVVVAFGVMIVPLGVVSITFIIIQPIVLGTWCTLCLIGAAAMVLQIPYALDELVASGQFLLRRKRAGKSLLRVFFTGDTDEGEYEKSPPEFARPPREVVADFFTGGIGLPWNLALCIAIGVWLMFTRLTLDASGGMADADHLIGALVVTTSVSALANVGRPLRLFNVLLGLALVAAPFVFDATSVQMVAGVIAGVALVLLSLPRGRIKSSYGSWDRIIV